MINNISYNYVKRNFMGLLYNFIDSYEELCEEFLLPIISTGKGVTLDNEYINPFVKLRSEFIKNKVNLYLNNLHLKTEQEKIEFTKKLTDEQKIFFTETINKIIDLDDSVQNYIMSYLTEEYNKNGNLNYFQKKLYYNINSLSEEDFQIFYCLYNNYLTTLEQRQGRGLKVVYNLNSNFIKKDMINVSLSRFSNIGILIYKNETTQKKLPMFTPINENEIELQTNEYYIPTEYSEELFNKLKPLFNDFNCSEILKVPKSKLNELW